MRWLEVLYRRGLIEKCGRGTQEIVDICLKAGLPEPRYEKIGGAVGVIFYPATPISLSEIQEELTERQKTMYETITVLGKTTFRDIREKVESQVTDRALRYDLNLLKKLGLIETTGPGRGAVWMVRDKKVDE